MASISGKSCETRDKIKRVQESLDQEIERVKELKNLLSISEAKVTQLKAELAEYKETIAPTDINRCPPEILSIIFKLSVAEDGNIHHIGRLLFVCRRWHALVMNDSQMWNYIRICVPEKWDMESWSRSTRLYIDSCVERSHVTSLSIELDFRALRTTEQQIMEMMRYGFLQLSASKVDHDLIYDWLEGLNYDRLEDHHEMMAPCLPGHAVDLIDGLVGIGGEAVLRWESFTLLFPSSDVLATMIWQRVAPNVSNLSRIHLIGVDWADLYWGYYDMEEGATILSLPQVKDLRMKELTRCERFISFDPSSIQRLAVELAFEEEFFSQLARFSQLRILTLETPGIPEDTEIDDIVTNRISIPTLEELVLIGEFHYLFTVKFDLPNLKRIRMESHVPVFTQPVIPTIQPLEVHWAAYSNMFFRDYIPETADRDIRGFFLSYKSSDRFSVASLLKDNTLKVLKELSTEGVLPPRWRTVSFHDVYGGIETMQIDNIVGSDQDVDMLTCS
jgi:F-box-like